MNTKIIVAVAIILAILGAGYALARPDSSDSWGGMMGSNWYGNGMMGSYGSGITGGYGGMMNGMMGQYSGMMSGMMGQYSGMMSYLGNGIWNGMMGGYGGMMGYGNGNGHCGAGNGYVDSGYGTNAAPITTEKAREAVGKYLSSTGNTDLRLAELIEFDNHFYAEIEENSTGLYAYELLVNRYTGSVFPEMGPNVMWNTKYGHMNWNTQAQTTITKEEARRYAQAYLDKAIPGAKADEADAFYGYYTVHVQKDDKTYGMLSINSYDGAVWYHNWHGAFVKILDSNS